MCGRYQGVIVYTMGDIPIGFGATARSTQDAVRSITRFMLCLAKAVVFTLTLAASAAPIGPH